MSTTIFTPEDANKNLAAGAVINCLMENNRRIGIYLGGFSNWRLNVIAGNYSLDPKSPKYMAAPTPPRKVVPPAPDDDGQVLGFVESTDPVCDMPDTSDLVDRSQTQEQIRMNNPLGTVDIGHEDLPTNPGYFNVGPNDNFPVGHVTLPQPDGFKYLRLGGINIHAGWYMKLTS